MSLCPCGSTKEYEACCGIFLDQHNIPDTPEKLMRSRYTAYSLAKTDYIRQTMSGKALMGFDESDAKKWAQRILWIGLEVKQCYLETPEKGYVEFVARFLDNNQLKKIHELSEFHKENNQWYYVNGINKETLTLKNKPKIGRNSLCPCGSGKKFKNCHER